MLASQNSEQSGHCILEVILHSFSYSVFLYAGDQFLRLVDEQIEFLILVQVCHQ